MHGSNFVTASASWVAVLLYGNQAQSAFCAREKWISTE